MNGDIAVRPNEINRFIDAILRNGLTFQAEHEHMYDFKPMVWFIHVRGFGNAVALARRAHQRSRRRPHPSPRRRRPILARRWIQSGWRRCFMALT
jgi:hypothetical protein